MLTKDYMKYIVDKVDKYNVLKSVVKDGLIDATKLHLKLMEYLPTSMDMLVDFQREKADLVTYEQDLRYTYVDWYEEAREQLYQERGKAPTEKSIEQRILLNHRVELRELEDKISESKLKCEFYKRMESSLDTAFNFLVSVCAFSRVELKALNLERKAPGIGSLD